MSLSKLTNFPALNFFIVAFLLTADIALAGEKVAYQDWAVDLGGANNEAYTITDASSSLGMFCSGKQCIFYLRQNFNCAAGTKHPILMSSMNISTALNMECTPINGNIFQILMPFESVHNTIQAGGESIGFVVAVQSGNFAVMRFSLIGAKLAIERALKEAAASDKKGVNGAAPSPGNAIQTPI